MSMTRKQIKVNINNNAEYSDKRIQKELFFKKGDSSVIYELGCAFLNAGKVNFLENVLDDRSKYQTVAGVANIIFSCELFLKCL